ncbi:MAG: hypothetical protein ABJE47_12720 [bacterium]
MAKIAEGRFGANTLRRDLIRFGSAVGIATVFSAVQVFVIPRRLDVAAYGHYRLFLLLVNYFGLLHFGLGEGAYLRWAGQSAERIAREWRRIGSWLLAIQVIVVIIALCVAPLLEPVTRVYVIAVAVCAMFVNLSALSSFALQAIGEFRRAGRVVFIAPSLFIISVLLVPHVTFLTALCCYVGSFAVAATYGSLCVLRVPISHTEASTPIALGHLIMTGFPVLAASLAGGLSQSIDRLLVSVAVPITSFAVYGFAATASVAANSATQAISRVALSHAANWPSETRARFLGGFYDLISLGYGIGLVAEPLFERMVTQYLPAYALSLPIVRALTMGLPFWVATHVVLVGTLQSYGRVRRQLAIELAGVAFVALLAGIAILLHAPLWVVGAASTTGACATLITGSVVVRRAIPEAKAQRPVRFGALIALQGASLIIALQLAGPWPAQCAIYALLAFAPTVIAARSARSHDW